MLEISVSLGHGCARRDDFDDRDLNDAGFDDLRTPYDRCVLFSSSLRLRINFCGSAR